MSNEPIVIECDSCGAVTSIVIIDGVEDDDEIVFCPICGEEMFEYIDDEDDEDDLDLDYDN